MTPDERVDRDRPARARASASGRDRRRPPTSTRRPSATILPGIRPELQTVATAKVEVAYGGRILGDDRLQAIRASYRQLRVGLLRLLFRRGDRKRLKR